MANAAVERAALDPGSARFVDAYIARLTTGFRNALETARADCDVSPQASLDDLAAFFAMSVIGISALLRAKATPDQMYAASRGALTVFKSP